LNGRPGLNFARACYKEDDRARAFDLMSEGMGKTGWNIAASIGLIAFSQAALAAPDSRAATAAVLLAQAAAPPAPAATPPAESKGPADQPLPAAASPPSPSSTETEEVKRAAKSAPGCALKFMSAEVAGKLKGRKWKEFRQEECGASTTEAVFPSTIAPKYSGEPLDKARTHTCADQFTANKAGNANGGLKWIELSGGYYSECVSRLKG
jgi:hypothetical protein